MKNYRLARTGCGFVSSFFILPSSFEFWVIRRARQRHNFPLGQLGREPLQTDFGKTDRRHRAAKLIATELLDGNTLVHRIRQNKLFVSK